MLVRAQPARARAPRRRQPEALRRSCSPRRRPARCSTRDAGAARARRSRALQALAARGARRAARADPRAAPARPRARRPARRAAQARRACCAACTAPTIELELDAGGRRAATATRDREVLRIAQEALHNALRHAARRRASRCGSRRATAGLVLEVADDGAGFDPADPELRSRHLGLTSMEERARAPRRRADDRARPRARARPCGWRSPRG